MFANHTPRFFVLLLTIILLLAIQTNAQKITLVDFGTDVSSNSFGLDEWNNLLLANDMSYSSEGPGGVTLQTNLDIFSDFMGVSGTDREFSMGERIVVTWYNTSNEIIYFTSRVSFTDNDHPSELPDGKWYTMRSFDDYRITYQAIQPHDTAKTVFNITDNGIHKTDSVYSLVNISLNIEWFNSLMKQFLICDKIELWNDADISPPCTPNELTAVNVSPFEIQLEWNYPCDDLDPVEYIIYRGDEIEGYSREMNFTVYNLNQNTEYSFSVTALDVIGNESEHSDVISVKTAKFTASADIINPSGFEYLGAIRLPEDFAYGADGLAYNPNGDGGETGSGASDGFPGSFFVTDINQPERGFVGEVSFPEPLLTSTKNLDELNQAVILQTPVNIRPENVNNWDYVDVWLTGLEYVEEEDRLYSSWAIYYDVIFDKTASISCVDADDLAGGIKYGAWFLGSSDQSIIPNDPYLNDYLFKVPQDWADSNTEGQALINGRYREGGLSGLGPTLYSTYLASAEPPAANTETNFTTLIQYGPVEGTDNYNFPNSLNDYNHADWLKDADWISVNEQNAVVIIGNKGLGHNYYGYIGERMRHDWVIADLPYPEFFETDPNGKGWKAYNNVPIILFYDPADIADVAAGILDSYDPQPYAALRLDKNLFFGETAQISSAAYDSYNNLLFITEFIPEFFGNIIIHVWEINFVETSIEPTEEMPLAFKLEQNYPNPFNPSTKIKFSIPQHSYISLKVYDVLGREVSQLINNEMQAGVHTVNFDASGLSTGIYFYKIEAGSFVEIKKMTLLK